MKCAKCSRKAIISQPSLCKIHFENYILEKVRLTISRYNLFTESSRILVAASGGKDSLAVLYLLNHLGYKVSALMIDEGISGYREVNEAGLIKFCTAQKIPLKMVRFRDEFGFTLDQAMAKKSLNPCTTCGVLRRYLLNKYSLEYDCLATGHNLDDEAQAVLMNLLRNSALDSGGPNQEKNISKVKRKFTRRIKPLYFISEKEIKTFTLIKGMKEEFVECPYVDGSYRAKVRYFLNREREYKENIINWHLSRKGDTIKDQKTRFCSVCGFPSSSNVCQACQVILEFKSIFNNKK